MQLASPWPKVDSMPPGILMRMILACMETILVLVAMKKLMMVLIIEVEKEEEEDKMSRCPQTCKT